MFLLSWLETQISRLDGMKNKLSKVDLDIPIDGKMPRGEYIRLMGDLMVASLQRGLTNVATLWLGLKDGILPIYSRVQKEAKFKRHYVSFLCVIIRNGYLRKFNRRRVF